MILVVHAHPYPVRSRTGGALLAAIGDVPGVQVRSLYQMYPDFDIDPRAEREALEAARLVVLLHPIFWYTTPAILKHWFDVVLVKGWAYGQGARVLKDKPCLWAVTTGGDDREYSPSGHHAHPFEAFAPVVEQTVRYCGMRWLAPFVVHAGRQLSDDELRERAAELRRRIVEHAA